MSDKHNLELNKLNKVIKLNPESAKHYFERGTIYASQKKYEKALKDVNKAIKLNPNSAEYYCERASIYTSQKKYEKALKDANKAIELNPNLEEYYCIRGSIFAHQEKYEKALKDANKAIELNPNSAICYRVRGNFFAHQEKYEKALKDVNKAIKLNPNSAEYYCERGKIYSYQKNYEKALKDVNKAIKLNPNSAEYYRARGSIFAFQENYEKALENVNKAIKLNPNSAEYYHSRGNIFAFQENYEKALENVNKAIELNPNSATYYHSRGNIFAFQENYEKELENVNKAIELNPNSATYYHSRGNIFAFQEKYEKALENYIKVNELSNEARFNYEEIFITSQMKSDAEGWELLLKLLMGVNSLMIRIYKSRSVQPQEIFHYTSDKSLKSIFDHGFRFYNVKYLNDTLEGNIFFELLKTKEQKEMETLLFSNNRSSDYSIYIGSFTTSEYSDDSGIISMWRTYGNGGKGSRSAGGSMLCWDRAIFSKKLPDTKLHLIHKSQFASEHSENKLFSDNSQHIEKAELFLLPVIYADSLEDLQINDGLKEVSKQYRKVGNILKDILSLYNSDKRDDGMNQNLIALTGLIVDKIRFLFKSKQYRYESEERIVVSRSQSLPIVKIDETAEEQNAPGRFHIKINPSCFTPHKVILGPTNTRVEEWKKYLNKDKKNGERIEVKQSKIKFKESE